MAAMSQAVSNESTARSRAAGAGAEWLNSTVLGIALASLCSDVGHEMATTAMPVFLAAIGASSAALGVIEGLADGASSFAKLYFGLYSDQLERRKPLAVICYLITALGMGSFALATSWWHVMLGRVGGWLGRGARTPVRNVLLTEATTPGTYGRAFGFERAMDSVGAFIGPILAIAMVSWVGMRKMFALTLIPSCAAAILIAGLVEEAPHARGPHKHLLAGLRTLPDAFRRFLVGVGIAGLGDFSKTLLILWATQAMTPALGLAHASRLAMVMYVGYNIVYAGSCYASGALADRLPKHRVLATGYALAAVPALVLMMAGTSVAKFAAVFALSGLYIGVFETVESASAAQLLPNAVRGTGFGVLATVNGIGDLLSSAVVGVLWTVAPHVAMSFVIAVSLAGAAIIAASGAGTPTDAAHL
jgi:MFS family permease